MSVQVCYLEEVTGQIRWDVVARTRGRGPKSTVIFEDGGWNPGKDCFFTEAQCRRYHNRPLKNWERFNESTADKLEKIAAALRRDR